MKFSKTWLQKLWKYQEEIVRFNNNTKCQFTSKDVKKHLLENLNITSFLNKVVNIMRN